MSALGGKPTFGAAHFGRWKQTIIQHVTQMLRSPHVSLEEFVARQYCQTDPEAPNFARRLRDSSNQLFAQLRQNRNGFERVDRAEARELQRDLERLHNQICDALRSLESR